MNLIRGDIWSVWKKPLHTCCITTNSVIVNGRLVMGKGIAKEAANRFPDLPKIMGLAIAGMTEPYYLRECPQQLICLQTKIHWRDPSPLWLVQRSLEKLGEIAERNPSRIYNLPRPGCGQGRLDWVSQVRPLFKTLPTNIFVWHQD